MSYYNRGWSKSVEKQLDHEKAWSRAKAVAWDKKWHALSVEARRAYLLEIKAPTKQGSVTQMTTLVDKIPARILEELTAAGFVEVEPAKAKKAAKIVPIQAAFDFSTRLRSMHRYHLLGKPDREELTKYVRYAFFNQGESVIQRVLMEAGIADYSRLEEKLELYVTTRRWPDWALESIKSKVARPVLEALKTADGPIPLVRLASMVKGLKPSEVEDGLSDLIAKLAVFEDVSADTFELIVGLLPEVREAIVEAAKPRKRPLMVVCDSPKEVSPLGGLDVNDLRIFLLEVAGDSPRLRRDGGIFQKDEPRFLDALPPHPAWLEEILKSSIERRMTRVYSMAKFLKFVEREEDDKTTWLRMSGKGRNWLAAGLEEQYIKVYDHHRVTKKQMPTPYRYHDEDDDEEFGDYEWDYSTGDSKFLGIPVHVSPVTGKTSHYHNYYEEPKPEQREALRKALYKVFQGLPVGVFHRWDSVLAHAAFGEHNPLLQGADPAKLLISIDRRQIPRLPEHVELAGKLLLEAFLNLRLLSLDAVQAGIDREGKLCVARLPRLEGYFGKPYESGDESTRAATRVIVQPDFSIVVIGLDPGPAAELAPFCDRSGGQAGQGVLTFKLTRESVIRGARQGLSASAIIARLKKHASVAVPENILHEVREWADWVRLVNIRSITVVRCPDGPTVSRVISALGKKAEGLGETLVALNVPKLTTAERQKLQDQGILIVKEDITISARTEPAAAVTKATPSLGKKRGRPKKVR